MADKQVWLVGYGGVGQAIAQKLTDEGYQVTILSRQPIKDNRHDWITLDYTDEMQVKDWVTAQSLPEAIIVTSGLLHKAKQMPEKTITQVTAQWLNQNIQANVEPTLNFAKTITPLLKPSSTLKMVALSARVGSIGDNRLGGWHSYRMSKAMLNMLIKNIAIEWQIKSAKSSIIGYHPGTVDTPLSAPFQSHLPPEKLFSPEKAALAFYEVFSKVTPKESGQVLDWAGKSVPP